MDDGILQPAYIVGNTPELLREYIKLRNALTSTYDEWEADSPTAKSAKLNVSNCQGVGRNLMRMGDELDGKYRDNTNSVVREYESRLIEYDNFKKAAKKLLSNITERSLQLVAVFEICRRYTSAYPSFSSDNIVEQHAVTYIHDNFTSNGDWTPEKN
ncbi:uncharacterized protein LOC106877837 [Octopus bimaculoides]|uniref:Uncharacterized protein n=1 Tax=Octopus bimaculoides TaxID=37653 RepID=A0A0L8IA65_OCTBM|nr:uncharacterized protein LOC106877837 [Octopus bimaculoides]XP_014782364.1 uncharacterized protein LOC106877837 [Octopus bimaculoides]XP_014782372.1 uncharacterized protein LOC106877837 [Octopus bimaculoides]|eukprot:XP_014782357.1 PREDICTED: uncharacterized protein LOC106877837 [Octopus bimaculoides]